MQLTFLLEILKEQISMSKIKITTWNIYFSWKLVKKEGSRFKLQQKARGENIAEVIRKMDADIIGIQECMSPSSLKFFLKQHDLEYDVLLNDDNTTYNLGLLYRSDKIKASKVNFDATPWRAKVGDENRRTYRFARKPLMVKITYKSTGSEFVVAVVHTKSKRVDSDLSREEKYVKSIDNRKRIIAAGDRLREIMWKKAQAGNSGFDKFLIMGDFNDHVSFDYYEKIVLRSGIESFIGTVLDPERILYSAINLSDGKGIPTTPFGGGVQLDHIIYTQSMITARGNAGVVNNSGKVRSDLVPLDNDGKQRDSDHAPVEVLINV